MKIRGQYTIQVAILLQQLECDIDTKEGRKIPEGQSNNLPHCNYKYLSTREIVDSTLNFFFKLMYEHSWSSYQILKKITFTIALAIVIKGTIK